MSHFIERPPRFELRRGVVHIIDECGDRSMLLGDFVTAATEAFALAQQWIAEANQPNRVGTLKSLKVAE